MGVSEGGQSGGRQEGKDRDILGRRHLFITPTRLFEPWRGCLGAVESLSLTSAEIAGCGDWPAAVAGAVAFSHRAGRGLGAHSSRNYS